MKRKNKIGFGFNLAFSVSLIVLGIIFLLYTIYLFTRNYRYDLDYALVFLLFVVSFLVTGIIKLVSVIRNKTGEYSNNLMAFNTFLFNATITIAIVVIWIIHAISPSIFTYIVALASPFIIMFTVIPTVLLLIAFPRKRNIIIKLVFMVVSTFISLIPIFISILYFIWSDLPFASFIFFLFFVLEVIFGIYLSINLYKKKKELDTLDDSITEEPINYELN